MSEAPILFSGAMIKAIFAGTKTQTRRVLNLPTMAILGAHGNRPGRDLPAIATEAWEAGLIRCPYATLDPLGHHVSGDLWVRETWRRSGKDLPDGIEYQAHAELRYFTFDAASRKARKQAKLIARSKGEWRPSIFMPRWASRLTLVVSSVRIERLQNITEADAKAEGVQPFGSHMGSDQRIIGTSDKTHGTHPYTLAYACLWDEINGDREGCSWKENPLVWVVTFRPYRREALNREQLRRAAP